MSNLVRDLDDDIPIPTIRRVWSPERLEREGDMTMALRYAREPGRYAHLRARVAAMAPYIGPSDAGCILALMAEALKPVRPTP